jgi:hypothetical protein
MPRNFDAKINERQLEISTYVPVMGRKWEMQFGGSAADSAMESHQIPDTVIMMWDLEDDPDGSEAEKAHKLAVEMSHRGFPFKVLFERMTWVINKVKDEEKKIREIERQALR